jgi:hypothetical protein
MKATLAVKFPLLAVSFLAAALLVGCATTKQVDWNSRVGNYTYDQAVAEFGSPTLQSQSTDGKVVAKWVTQPPAAVSLNTGMSHYGSTGFAPGQNAGSGNKASVLQLTFGADGKLTGWSKNY